MKQNILGYLHDIIFSKYKNIYLLSKATYEPLPAKDRYKFWISLFLFCSSLFQTLRKVLDGRGFQHTQIIASDNKWEILGDMSKDKELKDIVYSIG